MGKIAPKNGSSVIVVQLFTTVGTSGKLGESTCLETTRARRIYANTTTLVVAPTPIKPPIMLSAADRKALGLPHSDDEDIALPAALFH